MQQPHPSFSSEQDSPRSPAHAVAVRPKVLRRPENFDTTGGTGQRLVEQPSAAPTSDGVVTAQPSTPWQEDGRFGLVMFAVIAVLNIMLTYWLPALRHEKTELAQTDIRDTANLQPTHGRPSTVTLYAQPDHDWRNNDMFDMRQLSAAENSFSSSPQDFPIPEAQALGSEQ